MPFPLKSIGFAAGGLIAGTAFIGAWRFAGQWAFDGRSFMVLALAAGVACAGIFFGRRLAHVRARNDRLVKRAAALARTVERLRAELDESREVETAPRTVSKARHSGCAANAAPPL